MAWEKENGWESPPKLEPLLPPTSGTLAPIPYKSRLWIVEGGLNFMFVNPQPCWWFRLWQRVFLGWIWEELDG
jgi:hypothetical protein